MPIPRHCPQPPPWISDEVLCLFVALPLELTSAGQVERRDFVDRYMTPLGAKQGPGDTAYSLFKAFNLR